ncbi:MAG: hypothetical protein GY861_00840 [bacterium]|nr:hypothetical protein [bacterium]
MSEMDRPFEQLVAEGVFPEYSVVEKFGENPDIDTGSVPEDIWSHGGVYTFSTIADIDSMSSSDVDDDQTIYIQGLDENWELVTQTKALNGQTTVTLDTPLIRCFRMWNSSGTDLEGDVYIYINGASVTDGVPTVSSEVRAEITLGAGQTEMAIYTIPVGYNGYFYGGYVSLSRQGTFSADFTSRLRLFNGVFRVVSRIACVGQGNSSWVYKYPIPLALPEKTDILLRCEDVTDNNTGVSGGFTVLLKELA